MKWYERNWPYIEAPLGGFILVAVLGILHKAWPYLAVIAILAAIFTLD